MRSAFELIDFKVDPSPVWVGLIQSVEDLNETKQLRREEFAPNLLLPSQAGLWSLLGAGFLSSALLDSS